MQTVVLFGRAYAADERFRELIQKQHERMAGGGAIKGMRGLFDELERIASRYDAPGV